MKSNSHPMPSQELRIAHALLVSAILQTLVSLCALGVLGLFLAAGGSETLQDLITLCSAVSMAILKIGLRLLGI